MHLFSKHNRKNKRRDLMTDHRLAEWHFNQASHMEIAKLSFLVCLCFHIIIGASATKVECMRMVSNIKQNTWAENVSF